MRDHETLVSLTADRRVRGVLPVGARVGRYDVASVLGQGSFGITYKAHNAVTQEEVAIKEYFPASLSLREADSTVLPRSTDVIEEFVWGRERFAEEHRTLARLVEAPAIVRVLDFVEAHGTAYMVMALVHGETLDAILKREGRLTQHQIDLLLPPLLDGLEQVHAAGYLHRDIKPGNIIIDNNGAPTLIDFGAARAAMIGRTQTLTAVFTPGYAPIEQFTSGRQGPYTDIYAMGATLYHCISGRVPPGAIDRIIVDDMVAAWEVGKNVYSPRLLAAVDAALLPQASNRPQSIEAWRVIFETGTGAHSARTELISKGAAPPSGRRWVSGAAGLALLLMLVGGGYYVSSGPTAAEIEALNQASAEAETKRAQDERKRMEDERQRSELEKRARDAEVARRQAEAAQADAERARLKAEADRARLEDERSAQAQAQLKAEQEAKERADLEARKKAEEQARLTALANDRKLAEASEAGLRLSQRDRQQVQVALTSRGFDTKGTDGAFGPRTREMIADWQATKNQPTTGFLTDSQRQLLLREAASALAKFESDQKKLEEEQKRTDEERKKANEARKMAQEAAAAPSSPPLSPPASGLPGSYDGTYFARFRAAGGDRAISLTIAGNRGSGTVSNLSCGVAAISIAIAQSGTLTGKGRVYDSACDMVDITISGQASGDRLFVDLATGAKGTNKAVLFRQKN